MRVNPHKPELSRVRIGFGFGFGFGGVLACVRRDDESLRGDDSEHRLGCAAYAARLVSIRSLLMSSRSSRTRGSYLPSCMVAF